MKTLHKKPTATAVAIGVLLVFSKSFYMELVSDNKITLEAGVEYHKTNTKATSGWVEATTIDVTAAGTIFIRYKATETTPASKVAKFSYNLT